MTTFFTSDTHYGHKNIIKYCSRPFANVTEMDEALIANHNAKIRPDDEVWHLGDFSFDRKPAKYFHRLNGKKFLIKGNHDGKEVLNLPWDGLFDYKELKIEGQLIVLIHYGMRVWNQSHRGSWHLYGHSHGTLPAHGLSFDAGVDPNNYVPLSFDEVKAKMLKFKEDKEHMQRHADWNHHKKDLTVRWEHKNL